MDSVNYIQASKKNSLRSFLSRHGYLFICFAIPAALMYLLYLAIDIHPFGDGSVLVLDMNGQYVYFFEALRNAITDGDGLLYSFYRALGGEFLGMYAYYLASPLSYIVLLFPKHCILEAILTIILIKTGLCGASFGFYLRKHQAKIDLPITVAFASLYALSAYGIVYQSNTMWIDGLIWLPILTYAIEELIRRKSFILYVIALSLTMMSNYYIGYMTCIYAVIYFFYYCFSNDYAEINPIKESGHLLKSFVRFIAFSLLSAAISALILFAAYHSLSMGKTEFSDPSFAPKFNFNILELLSKLLPASYDTVRPQGLPLIYSGVISLLLVPIYFFSKKTSAKEKAASAIFIGIFILSFIFNPLDMIWHGFQSPQWLNYRYSFMLCFFLLVLSFKTFVNVKAISPKALVSIGILVIVGTTILGKYELDTYITSENHLLRYETVLATVIITCILLVVLLFIKTARSKKMITIMSVLFAVVISGEMLLNGAVLMRQYDLDVIYSGYEGYNSFIGELRPLTEQLKEHDNGFYRVEKTTHKKFNDNMALGIRGISSSTSTLHKDSLSLISSMGYFSKAHRAQYKGGNPVGDSLLGIKYVIDKNDSLGVPEAYVPVISNGNYTVYQNPYALSLAYGVSNSIQSFDADEYNTHFERLNAMVSDMIGYGESVEIFKGVTDCSVLGKNCIASKNDSSFIYSAKSSEKKASVSFTFTAPNDGEYYFYPMSEHPFEVNLRFDGKYYGTYLGERNDNVIYLGSYRQGDTVEIDVILKNNSFYLSNEQTHVWYFDDKEFSSAFDRMLASPQFVIDESFSSNHITGSIETTNDDQLILTTLPFDKGWKVYVDGERVSVDKTLDALISFNIDNAGKHSVELRYAPDSYLVGATISILGIITFIGLIIYTKKIRPQEKADETYTQTNELNDVNDTEHITEE